MQPITVTKTDRWGHTHTAEVYRDRNGVYRWASNDAVPPGDCTVPYGIHKLPGFSAVRQQQARNAETKALIAAYRKAQRKAGPPSGERLAEMRAAFGPGAVVVDVISGRRIQL